MIRFLFLFLISFAVLPLMSAKAENIPDYVLDKDYESCMGEDTPQSNPEHARYCECARSKMRSWDLETYGTAASEQAKNPTDTAKVSEKIGEIAKACLAEVLK